MKLRTIVMALCALACVPTPGKAAPGSAPASTSVPVLVIVRKNVGVKDPQAGLIGPIEFTGRFEAAHFYKMY